MRHQTGSGALRVALATTLTATLALTAVPASAASVNGSDATSIVTVVPAGGPAAVTFDRWGSGGETTFPAGTYWVSDFATTPVLPFLWVEGLSERLENPSSVWTRVVLDAPGQITYSIPDVGEVGRTHTLAVLPMPADAGDPSTMTGEQVQAAVDAAQNDSADIAVTEVVAGNVTTTMAPTVWEELPSGFDQGDARTGDFLGIGTTTQMVRAGNHFVFAELDGAQMEMHFGRPGDELFVGDFDGDGMDTVGLRRGNTIFLANSPASPVADATFTFGRAGDTLLVGDWDGDGVDSLAVRRGATTHVSNDNLAGRTATSFSFGRADDVPIAGDFDGDGLDSISVLRPPQLLVNNHLAGGAAESAHAYGSGD